ncbi:MAG: NUDIX hydrolase [Chitinophagaceae bacterium]
MDKKKIIAAGGLVENEKGEILMMFRRGFWDLPKGKLDDGESIETCAVREVEEETGLQNVLLISFLCKTYHEYFDKWINEDVIKETWWYTMKSSSSEKLIPQTEEDIEKLIWVDKKEMDKYLKNTYPSIKEVVSKSQK